MPRIRIRKADQRDCAALSLLMADAAAMHADRIPHVFRKPGRRADWVRFIRSVVRQPGRIILLAQIGDLVVGMIGFSIRTAPAVPVLRRRRFGHVSDMVVQKGYRRMGVGRHLMRGAFRWLKARRVGYIELNVWGFNRSALSFYRKLGFEVCSRRMEKSL